MGRSLKLTDPITDSMAFEAIICAWVDTSATIDDIKIFYNDFYNNPFDTFHGHEKYLTHNIDAEIKGNKISNNGVGTQIRFSNKCTNIVIDSNYVLGAAKDGFIHDWKQPHPGYGFSSDIKVTNNVWGLST